MKKLFLFFLFSVGLGTALEAQQLTRFAVVDLTRVYLAFFSESRAVRDLEERAARVQAEIDRMTREIQNLRVDLVNEQAQGNHDRALRLEAEINRRTDFLRDYYRVQTEALQAQRDRLSRSGGFQDQVLDEIRFIAESEGFSMVLNLRDNTGILWFSPTVDITDRVIQSLMNRAGRR